MDDNEDIGSVVTLVKYYMIASIIEAFEIIRHFAQAHFSPMREHRTLLKGHYKTF